MITKRLTWQNQKIKLYVEKIPMKLNRLTVFLAFIFLLAPDNHLLAASIEEEAGRKTMDDTELKTDGAATRKPLPSIEKDAKKTEAKKIPSFIKDEGRGVSFDINFYQLNGEITRKVTTTRKILEDSPFSRFPRTEFEFPIDALVCSVNHSIKFSGKWGLALHFQKVWR